MLSFEYHSAMHCFKKIKRIFACLFILLVLPSGIIAEVSFDPQKKAQLFYNWIVATSNLETGLPTSHIGDPRLKEWTHTYDAAVCTMAYLAMGDVTRAKRIMDYYVGLESVRRLGGVIEAVLNFSKRGRGIDWQVRTGSNMWLGIAAFHLYKATDDEKYLKFAKKQADFGIAMQENNLNPKTYGAVPLGPKGVEYNLKDQHILWEENNPKFVDIYSTEMNIDFWALLNMLSSVAPEEKYKVAKDQVKKWLQDVALNQTEQRFNRGFYLEPDTIFAPDTHFWALSAFGPKNLNQWKPSLSNYLMLYAQNKSEVSLSYKKKNGEIVEVVGYDFVDKENPVFLERGPVISPEWTFQAVLALSLLAENSEDPEDQTFYETNRNELLLSMLSMADVKKNQASFPYASRGNVSIGHEYNTPAEGNISVIGAAWAILALMDYDPLNLEKIQKRYSVIQPQK